MTTELVMVSSPAFKRWVAEVKAWSRYVDENKIPEHDMERRYLQWRQELHQLTKRE